MAEYAKFDAAVFKVKEGEKSIHDSDGIRFSLQVLNVGDWHENVLRHGLSLDFKEEPQQYREKNNVSASMNAKVFREKVDEWHKDGHVEKLDGPAGALIP